MAVTIKSEREIALMRTACGYLSEVLDEMVAYVRPGMSTKEINDFGDKLIRAHGCVPNFLNYEGFPGSFCLSVNEEVVHGIPSKKRIVKEGDLLSIDGGLIYKGYHSDAARSLIVGGRDKADPAVLKLMDVTEESFFKGIEKAVAGNHLYDISNAIADYVEPFGYGIIEDLTGHGIGRHLHEDPMIPNYRQHSRGIRLKPGMTLAVEPMIALGTWEVDFADDGWTCTTKDKKVASHYENTILVTDGAPEILTLPGGRKRKSAEQ